MKEQWQGELEKAGLAYPILDLGPVTMTVVQPSGPNWVTAVVNPEQAQWRPHPKVVDEAGERVEGVDVRGLFIFGVGPQTIRGVAKIGTPGLFMIGDERFSLSLDAIEHGAPGPYQNEVKYRFTLTRFSLEDWSVRHAERQAAYEEFDRARQTADPAAVLDKAERYLLQFNGSWGLTHEEARLVASVMHNQALALYQQGKFNEAWDRLDTLIRRMTQVDDPRVRTMVAGAKATAVSVYLSLGRPDDAFASANMVVEDYAASTDPEILFHVARCSDHRWKVRHQQGLLDEARALAKDFVARFRDHPDDGVKGSIENAQRFLDDAA